MTKKITVELDRSESLDITSALLDRAVIAASVDRPDVAIRLVELCERIAQIANDNGWDI